jgi:ketosteroid isomerase-like protein
MVYDRPDPLVTIALQFNACINARDLEGLAALITDDHTFIDSANNIVRGKEHVVNAWQEFFALFPDYQNIFEQITSRDHLVAIRGRSICSEQQLDGPAMWTAKLRGTQVAEWRVYLDTPDNRKTLNLG